MFVSRFGTSPEILVENEISFKQLQDCRRSNDAMSESIQKCKEKKKTNKNKTMQRNK